MKWFALLVCAVSIAACSEDDADPFAGEAVNGIWQPDPCPSERDASGGLVVSLDGIDDPAVITRGGLQWIARDIDDPAAPFDGVFPGEILIDGRDPLVFDDSGNGVSLSELEPAPGECIGVEYVLRVNGTEHTGRVIVVTPEG